jgi:hypothetical protein
MAADCGFCTAGWEVTAKGLLDKNNNPTVDEVKAALAGHICRCARIRSIVRTVIDTGKVLRGEAEIRMSQKPQRRRRLKSEDKIVAPRTTRSYQPAVRATFSTGGGHGPEDTLDRRRRQVVTKKWQGYPPQNLNIIGKPNPPMPEVAIPRYLGTADYASRVHSRTCLDQALTSPHPRAKIRSWTCRRQRRCRASPTS